MARPIFVVHDQETIENYRRLERILRELYQVLGELLAYGAPVVPATILTPRQDPPPPPPPSETPTVLQNVINILATLLGQSVHSNSSRNSSNRGHNSRNNSHHRRHRRQSIDASAKPVSFSPAFGDWSAIGSELRQVADTLAPNVQSSSNEEGQIVEGVPESYVGQDQKRLSQEGNGRDERDSGKT